MEACLELLESNAVVAMQDLGAAGLTSSVIECASRGDVGVDIDVAMVPRRETGMTAYEVMLSESQERMVLVATPDKVDAITEVLDRWSLSAAAIGTVTDDGVVRVRDGEEVHVEVPVRYLIDECPTYPIDAVEPESIRSLREQNLADVTDIDATSVGETLLHLMETPNVGTRSSVWEQYDHTILTNTVFGPGASDAAVLRQKGTDGGIAVSMDCNSRYCYLDPYDGARHAVLEAIRNVACSGARPLGLTNCLNFGSPERSPANWQLTRAVQGLGDACREIGVPIVSGNVSLYNETDQQPIYPTPMVGCVGVLENLATRMGLAWQDSDDIWLVGDAAPTLGGSEYLASRHGRVAGAPPAVDLDAERRLLAFLEAVSAAGERVAAHDVSGGGLAVALTEMALAANIGATIAYEAGENRIDVTWFGESGGRVLIAAAPSVAATIERLGMETGVPVRRIGSAGGDGLGLGPSAPVSLVALDEASARALAVGVEAEMA
jgi:phosphoribosylformylglycinamidine synthase subunit PurL